MPNRTFSALDFKVGFRMLARYPITTILSTVVAVMHLVGTIACAVPVRRALRIDPTEALRAEG